MKKPQMPVTSSITKGINKIYDMAVIGGSSGSLVVLKNIMQSLRKDIKASVTVVYHIHRDSGDFLVKHLNETSNLNVRQVSDKDIIEQGIVYFAPPNYHILIEPQKTFALSVDEPVNYSRPSIDILFESASDVYKDKLIGIILSGANADGSSGLHCVKEKGGLTIVQSPASAEMDTMPNSAIAATPVDLILEPEEIGLFLNRLIK